MIWGGGGAFTPRDFWPDIGRWCAVVYFSLCVKSCVGYTVCLSLFVEERGPGAAQAHGTAGYLVLLMATFSQHMSLEISKH